MAKKPCKVTLKSGGKLYPMNMAEFMTELKNGLLQKLIDEGSISELRLGVREQEEVRPPVPPAPPVTPIEDEGASKRRKALLNKAYEGSEKDMKAEIKKYGLDYDVESRTDAREKAKNFIEAVGFETALEAVRLSQLDDGAAAYVFAELIDTIEQEMMSASTPEEMNSLRTFQASLINEFDKKARSAGRFVSSLADIYQNSLFNYSAERKINEYKEKNGGYISQETEEKIRKAAQEIKDLNDKIEELKKKIKEQEDKDNIATIVQSTKQKTEAKVTNTQRAKKLADAFRQLKTKPITFKDSNGNPINTAGITWNDLVEIGARAIEATGRIADGIAAVMDKISEQDWYKRLSQGDKDAIQAQVEGMFTEETPGDINIPAGVIRSLVESGIDTIDGLVAAVRPLIAESYPDATDRDIRDAITGYAKEKKKTRDDIVSEIAKLKRVGKLMSELEDLRSGIEKERDERRKAQKTETEKELLRQIDEMLDALGIKEKRRTERSKRAAQKRIEQLEERIRNGDFSKTKPSPVVEDSELARLRARRQELQDDIDTEIYRAELQNRKPIQKFLDYIMELWSLPRALMATGEWSFMLIQGGIQTIAHPINASRALYKTLQHLVSEKKAKEWGNFVKSQPFYDEMKRAGLSLSEYDAKLNAREEQFLGGWVNYLWDYLGYPTKFISKNLYENWKSINPLKALERASVAYMNTLRILRYQQGKEMLYKQGKNFNDDPDSFKNMADVINTFTGRAKLGPFEGSSRALSMVFFSPRNWASILKTSTPWALYHFGKMGDKGTFKPSVAQKMAMADYMKFVLFTAGLVAMAALHYNGDDDDETEVVLDPTSSDFLKIKLGDTRIDPWGGRLQMIVYQARMIQGAMTTGGEKKKLGEGLTPTYTELTLRTIQSKLAPTAALLVKAGLTEPDKEGNRKLFGKEFIMSEELAGTLYPMYIGTLNELWKEQPETVSSFLTLYAFLGGGVQTYETKKSEPLFKEGEFEYNPRKYNSFESDSWQTITENTKEPMTKEFKDILSEMIQIETKKTIEENKGTGSYKEYMKSEEGMEKWTGKNRDIAIKKVKVEFNSIVKSKLNNVDKMSPEEKTQAIFSARQQAVDQLMLKYNMVKED